MIKVAKTAGFCFGVSRAVNIVEELLGQGKKVTTLGPIIHNPQMVDSLAKRGVRIVQSPEEAEKDSTLVIRSHGVSLEVMHKIEECMSEYRDATCPFFRGLQVILMVIFTSLVIAKNWKKYSTIF